MPAPTQAPADTLVVVQDALGDTVAAQTVDAVIDHFAGAEAAAPATPAEPAGLQGLLLAQVGPAADHGPLPFTIPHIDDTAALAAAA
jgi:hypothetical protein